MDNDHAMNVDCAELFYGGWWYNACLVSNLNGLYNCTTHSEGDVWFPWRGWYDPLKSTEMKLRPVN